MWPNPQEAFTKEILNGKLYFLCSDSLKHLLIFSSAAVSPGGNNGRILRFYVLGTNQKIKFRNYEQKH